MRQLAVFIATAGYAGFVPYAPGTVGSAVGLVVYAAIRWSGRSLVEGLAILALLGVGVWAADQVERRLGKDPAPVVIDEVVGMLVTLAFLDVTPVGALVGFMVFRLFDVIKPFPAARLERLHGGAGIMLDDVAAGAYAHLALRALAWLMPGLLA
ncbi:MAG: phosphatidylglycerophosphatase A family protein [Acidobacteriota bacterium]